MLCKRKIISWMTELSILELLIDLSTDSESEKMITLDKLASSM